MKKCILSLLPALFIMASLSSCKPVKDLELKGIEKVRLDQFGLNNSDLSFDLLFFNPNSYKLKIKEASGDAWIDDKPLGHFTFDSLMHIPALADFHLPVQLKMDMSHITENMSAVLTDKLVTLKVEGMARAGKGFIFINYPLRYEVKQRLSELLK